MTWGNKLAEHRERREAERKTNMAVLLLPHRSLNVGWYGKAETVAAPKESMLESAAYEAAVRNLGYCVRCGRTCRPQFCHADMGKGQSIKTDVRRGWAGCGRWSPMDPGCHYVVGTSGTLPKAERRAEDERLGRLTRDAVRKAGTWPKGVPDWVEA